MPDDPESLINHFKIWQTQKKRIKEGEFTPEREYTLKDQFQDNKYSIIFVEWIANPVTKDDHPIVSEDAHLMGYTVARPDDKPIPGWVMIRNQFTRRKWVKWTLGIAKYLLVPASKVLGGGDPPPDPTKRFDHYLCYEVTEADPVKRNTTLEDQFDTHLEKKEDVTKLVPKFLGVPVQKSKERRVHKDAHLAIYELNPQFRIPVKKAVKVSTNDQVRPWRDLPVIRSLYLAVPSEKSWHRPHHPRRGGG